LGGEEKNLIPNEKKSIRTKPVVVTPNLATGWKKHGWEEGNITKQRDWVARGFGENEGKEPKISAKERKSGGTVVCVDWQGKMDRRLGPR